VSAHKLVWAAVVGAVLLGCDQGVDPSAPALPAAGSLQAASGTGGQVAVATGSYRISAPPEVFGVVIEGRFTFNADAHADGRVSGHYLYDETYPDDGVTLTYRGSVTCFKVYDGTRAKIGGLIEESNDPLFPAGAFLWWTTKDNGDPRADWSSFGGAGDEAANEAFCNSANLPRFGPFLLEQGNSNVKQF